MIASVRTFSLPLQVVWASSREVGCGYHYCATLDSSSLTNAYYFVCNYGPASVYLLVDLLLLRTFTKLVITYFARLCIVFDLVRPCV